MRTKLFQWTFQNWTVPSETGQVSNPVDMRDRSKGFKK